MYNPQILESEKQSISHVVPVSIVMNNYQY